MCAYKIMNDNITLLVNHCFFDEEDLAYADKHRFNVKYTEVRSTGFAKLILQFQNHGYKFSLKTEPDFAPDGLKLEDKICAYFTHPENIDEDKDKANSDVIDDERIIITGVLNYLICLSRLVSPAEAKKAFGFEFDGAIIDLFVILKNNFFFNNLKIEDILNNKLYKHIVNELSEMERTNEIYNICK